MGTRDVSQCFGCGWSVKVRWTLTMGSFTRLLCMLVDLPCSAGAIAARHRARTTSTQPSGCSLHAPGSAQHERSVGTVSPTLGRRPQLQRPDACMEHQQACTPITTPASHARGREAEFTQVGGWDSSSDSDAGHSAVEESD